MITNSFLYPPAQVSNMQSAMKNGGDESIQKAIASAILTAIDGGLFTCTVSVSGIAHVNTNMRTLGELGYTISLSGTTLTISW